MMYLSIFLALSFLWLLLKERRHLLKPLDFELSLENGKFQKSYRCYTFSYERFKTSQEIFHFPCHAILWLLFTGHHNIAFLIWSFSPPNANFKFQHWMWPFPKGLLNISWSYKNVIFRYKIETLTAFEFQKSSSLKVFVGNLKILKSPFSGKIFCLA